MNIDLFQMVHVIGHHDVVSNGLPEPLRVEFLIYEMHGVYRPSAPLINILDPFCYRHERYLLVLFSPRFMRLLHMDMVLVSEDMEFSNLTLLKMGRYLERLGCKDFVPYCLSAYRASRDESCAPGI